MYIYIRIRRRTSTIDLFRDADYRGNCETAGRTTISVAGEAYRAPRNRRGGAASRRKIAHGRILRSRRRKRAAKITAKTARRPLYACCGPRERVRTGPLSSSEEGTSRRVARFFRKSFPAWFPLPTARYLNTSRATRDLISLLSLAL